MSRYWIYFVAGCWNRDLESNSSTTNSKCHFFSFNVFIQKKKILSSVWEEDDEGRSGRECMSFFLFPKAWLALCVPKLVSQTFLYAKLSQALLLHYSIFLASVTIFITIISLHSKYMFMLNFWRNILLTFFSILLCSYTFLLVESLLP